MSAVLIRNATILTMNDAMEVVRGDVWVRGGRIAGVGGTLPGADGATVVDAGGDFLLPGFVQTHVHLCQTIFRGLADDLPLLEWLRARVWPLEAAHDPATLAAAAQLAAAELLAGGTTTVLTMETVHDTDAVFEALVPTGLRAIVGKCLMNERGDAPPRLHQDTQAALEESLALHRRWTGAANGRLRASLAPRFAISCTRDLLEATAAMAQAEGLLVHTHASEQRDEVTLVRERTGRDNIDYLAAVGLATPRLCVAHCVWVSDAEQALLAERKVKVLHCPGSNLKLGSGIAPVPEMRARGISVSLGADGAACNNSLDMFHEMRLAATLPAMRLGPGALTARDAVHMATREGAFALGLDHEIGSIEIGKKADLILVAADRLHQSPGADPYATLVYATRPTDVWMTMVDGEIVARDGRVRWTETAALADRARAAARTLMARVSDSTAG